MSTPTAQTARPKRAGRESRPSPLDTIQLGGRPLRYYLTGWRFGLVALLIAAVFPAFQNQTMLVVAISIGVYVLLALGLNIVVGYAGLLDLGYVAFFAFGAYTVAIFTEGLIVPADGAAPVPFLKVSWWLLLPLAALVAGLFGALLGAPTLRLRGDYLAIVTLGFGEIVPIVFQNVPWFFGQLGMTPQPPADIATPLGAITFSSRLDNMWFYWLTLALVALMVLGVASLRDSSLGRAWVAIREDETAAAASGVNLVRTKLLAFGLGATVGGIGGALNAAFLPSIAPPDFNFGISITILIMIVLGGIGSIPGVILGAAILKFIDVYLLGQIDHAVHSSALVAPDAAPLHFLANVDFNQAKLLIYGIVLVLMILLRPQGLIPDVRRKRELKGEGAAAEGTSAVGLLEREEAGLSESEADVLNVSDFVGAGSDAQGREGGGDSA